jgi:hypothetical protein
MVARLFKINEGDYDFKLSGTTLLDPDDDHMSLNQHGPVRLITLT